MRVSLYFLLVATLTACAKAIEEPAYYGERQLRPLDMPVDQETIRYLLPKLAAKYRPNSDWTDVVDPRLYILSEMESADEDGQASSNNIRNKRIVLSIHAPIDALQKLYKQQQRRQKVAMNQAFLRSLPDVQKRQFRREDSY